MNILLFIDNLGSGGAQKQLVSLACILKKNHHNVQVAIYNDKHLHFASNLSELDIKIHYLNSELSAGFSIKTLINLSKLIRHGNFDLVSSYLTAPNIYLEQLELTILILRL